MKKFNFINQSLWAGSSPNQTSETLTRENRIGVKSWLNRGLMLLITILTLGVGQMWGTDSSAKTGTITVYFKNTVNWTNVYVYFYDDSYWNSSNGSGSASGGSFKDGPCEMTYNSSLELYSYTYTGTYSKYISFTKDSQSDYGNFWNTEAIYNASFSTSSPIYIPDSDGSTENKNYTDNNTKWTKYYKDGQWVSLTTRTVYFANTNDWTTPYAYAYNEHSSQVVWHGTKMTPTDKTYGGKTIYTFTTLYDASNIIFNDGESSQTADLGLGSTYDGKIWDGDSWEDYYFDQAVTVSSDANGSVDQEGTVTLSGAGTTLTATPTNEYTHAFSSWTIDGGGITTNSGNNTTNPDVFWATTDGGTIEANFVPRWVIKGNKSGEIWGSLTEVLDVIEGNKCQKTIHLDGKSTYQFVVYDRYDGSYYKNESAFVGQTTSLGMSTSQTEDCHIATAESGDYIFEFDGNTKALKVTYPTVTHPTENYVYCDKGSLDWTVRVHVYTESTPISKDWKSRPYPSTCTINGTTYYYAALGGQASVIFSEERNDDAAQIGKINASSNLGKYLEYANSSWSDWKSFVFAVTLNPNGGEIAGGQDVTSYTFGTGASLPTSTYVTKTGYTFAGWYDNSGLSGSAVTAITTTDNGAKRYWAKWDPNTLYFRASSTVYWNNTSNWSEAILPTIEHDVVIEAPVTVDITDAVAKSVEIYNNGSTKTGHLTINAGQALVVAGTVNRTTDGSTESATEEADILIDSDLSNGNGALVMKEHDGYNKATVNFATKAYKTAGEHGWVNQYIGTPFNDQGDPTYNYYGMELYAFDAANQSWEGDLASEMNQFYGYTLLSNSGTQNVVLNMTGTLVASTTAAPSQTVDKDEEVMFANSWVAPIKISTLTAGNFTNSDATIYIFNAASLNDWNSTGFAGNYMTIPVDNAPDNYHTIPSMQAFSLLAKANGAVSLALNYNTNVYAPAKTAAEERGVTIEPNHAPQRRVNANEISETQIIVQSESGYGDNVRISEGEDFTTGFDNGWEGHKLFGLPEAPQFYAVSGEDKMAVLATPDVEGTVLCFQAGSEDTQYTLSFKVDESAETLYLYDMNTKQETVINNENTYNFTTSDKVAHNRFVISKVSKMPTGVENTSSEGVKAVKFIENGELLILRDGKLYNVMGTAVK